MVNRNLFAYGTLMCEDIFRSVAGCLPGYVPALLKGYRRFRVTAELYPGIIEESSSQVQGIVYFNLGDDAWKQLDAFEGEQYERIFVTAQTDTGSVPAATYLFRRQFRHQLSTDSWEYEDFMARKAHFVSGYQGFSEV